MTVTWFRFEAGEIEALTSVAPITDWKIRIDGRVARFSAAVSGVGVSLARKLNGYDVEVEINPVSTCALVPDLRHFAAIVREAVESHRRIVAASEGEAAFWRREAARIESLTEEIRAAGRELATLVEEASIDGRAAGRVDDALADIVEELHRRASGFAR